jgi:RNA polymerase sigma-70 factor (ECF subfamily)
MNEGSVTRQIQGLLNRLGTGDANARDELIQVACERLIVLTRRMLHGYPQVRQMEQTDDVLQNAAMRLRRALGDVSPENPRAFFALACAQIRRELLDLKRRHYGRTDRGPSPNDDGNVDAPKQTRPRVVPLVPAEGEDGEALPRDATDLRHDPGLTTLDLWTNFHQAVQELPDKERETVQLLWYQELSQEEAAEVLGLDKSTVKRRWRSAKLLLYEALKGQFPGEPQLDG